MFNPIKALGTIVKVVTAPLSSVLNVLLPKGVATGTGAAGVVIGALVHVLVIKGVINSESAQSVANYLSGALEYIGAGVAIWGASRAHHVDGVATN